MKLITPNTGYPDLELKIAYGLARLVLEAFKDADIRIKKDLGYYNIIVDKLNENDDEVKSKLKKTFETLIARRVDPKVLIQTPGFQEQTAKAYDQEKLKYGEFEIKDYSFYFKEQDKQSDEQNKSYIKSNKNNDVCPHKKNKETSVSAVIGITSSTSYHHFRDILTTKTVKNNQKIRRPSDPKEICINCSLLAILGQWFAGFVFKYSNSDNRKVVVLPIPKTDVEISKTELHEIFALQHLIKNSSIGNKDLIIQEISIPLIILSQFPSLASVFSKFDMLLSIINKRSRSTFKVETFIHIPLENYIKFVNYSPFNVAVVKKIINKNASKSLQELAFCLRYSDVRSLARFARFYASETSSNEVVNLLPPITSKYLLKEVAKMSESEIFSQEILSIAKTLRFFVRNKNYYYADEIRNAKNHEHFMEIIGRMLRDAWKEKEKNEGSLHLPAEKEIIALLESAGKSEENFKKIKLALYVLAFTFPTSDKESQSQ